MPPKSKAEYKKLAQERLKGKSSTTELSGDKQSHYKKLYEENLKKAGKLPTITTTSDKIQEPVTLADGSVGTKFTYTSGPYKGTVVILDAKGRPVSTTPAKSTSTGKTAGKTTPDRYTLQKKGNSWYEAIQEAGYDVTPDDYAGLKATVPTMQGKRSTGVYGEKDWKNDQEAWASFTKNQAWYMKTHPNFDPTDPIQVEDFQTEHNKRMDQLGLPKYFDTNWSKAHAVDGDFGGVTAGAPNPDKITKKTEKEKEKGDGTKTGDIETNPDPKYNQASTYAPFWLQDAINTAGAAGDFLRLKKYLPWAPPAMPVLPEATFYDPTRELAANAEQMNIGTQGANAFSGPQRYASVFSQIQGQGAKNAADILAKYNNLNVTVSNQQANTNAGILNQTNQYNAGLAKELYDKTTVANQQFDNAKNQARQELRKQFTNAITNRAQAQSLNSLYPNYHFNPANGGLTDYFVPSKIVPGQQGADFLSKIQQGVIQTGWSPETVAKIYGIDIKDQNEDEKTSINKARQSVGPKIEKYGGSAKQEVEEEIYQL